jgi:large repetitive protein
LAQRFQTGVQNADGSWTLSQNELAGLTLQWSSPALRSTSKRATEANGSSVAANATINFNLQTDNNTIRGGNGNDTIDGGSGADTIS